MGPKYFFHTTLPDPCDTGQIIIRIGQSLQLIRGIPYKIQILGAICIRVISHHDKIQVPSHDTPLDPSNQGKTLQNSNIGENYIQFISQHGKIQFLFQETSPDPNCQG